MAVFLEMGLKNWSGEMLPLCMLTVAGVSGSANVPGAPQ